MLSTFDYHLLELSEEKNEKEENNLQIFIYDKTQCYKYLPLTIIKQLLLMYIHLFHSHIIGKPFKKIPLAHKIEECAICRNDEACVSGMSTADSLPQLSVRLNKFWEQNSFNWRKYFKK